MKQVEVSKLDNKITQIAFAVIAAMVFVLLYGQTVYGQFYRQSGNTDWGYGYGYGYGQSSGWDYGSQAGQRENGVLALSEFGYGYGYGFGINYEGLAYKYDVDAFVISWDQVEQLVQAGVLVIHGGEGFTGYSLEFFANVIILEDDLEVHIDAGTIMDTGGSFVNFGEQLELTPEFSTEGLLEDVGLSGEDYFGQVAFGLSEYGLTLSQPVTIVFPVNEGVEADQARVYHRSPGEGEEWSSLGVFDIEEGYCSFTTSSLSGFVLAEEEAESGGHHHQAVETLVTLNKPNGGQTWTAGMGNFIFWGSQGSDIDSVRISLSLDSGSTWATIATDEVNDGAYNWAVSDTSTEHARIKVEAHNASGDLLSTTESQSDFTIVGTPAPPSGNDDNTPPGDDNDDDDNAPDTDPNTSGNYDSSDATGSTPSINVDMDLDPVDPNTALCVSGSLVKGPSVSTVYFCGADGKRHVFPNEAVFNSWFDDFSSLVVLTDSELAAIPLGGLVTYRPGVRMIKVVSDSKSYAVARGGILRHVSSEAVAIALYGADWNTKIDDVSDAFFFSYTIGDPITLADVTP